MRSVGDGGKELSALEKIRSGLTCRKVSHDEVIGQVDGERPHPSNGTPRTMAMSYICPVQYGCGDSAAQLGSAHLRN